MDDMSRIRIGRVYISTMSADEAAGEIAGIVMSGGRGYVCVSNMRTVVIASRDDEYLRVMQNSLLNLADGTPLVWCGKLWGVSGMERCCGPDLMGKMLPMKGLRHYFLGDTRAVLDKLTATSRSVFGAEVLGSYSPPFAPLDEYDIAGMASMINESGANVVWTSLRAPKQDFLGRKLLPYLNDGIVLIGVGAAFRFLTGEYELDRGVLQKIGLGGLKCLRNTTFFKEMWWYVKHSLYLTGFMIDIMAHRFISVFRNGR